jgi:AcrR family transcriptional regulator
MDDIARRAGISKKTLYQQFANKLEVVNESVLWYKNEICVHIEKITESAENAVEAIVIMLSYMDTMHRQMNPIALFELQRYFPEAFQTFREKLIDKDVVMIKENLEQGIREGLYREDINTDILARYRLETSLLILQPNLMVSDRNNLMSVALEIGEHFLYGIMNERGEKLYRQYKEKYLKNETK